MNKHFPSIEIKKYPFCPADFEPNIPKENNNDNLCTIYCNKMTNLLLNNESNIKCINEIIKDDLYLKLLGYLNNFTQKVNTKMILCRKLEYYI